MEYKRQFNQNTSMGKIEDLLIEIIGKLENFENRLESLEVSE